MPSNDNAVTLHVDDLASGDDFLRGYSETQDGDFSNYMDPLKVTIERAEKEEGAAEPKKDAPKKRLEVTVPERPVRVKTASSVPPNLHHAHPQARRMGAVTSTLQRASNQVKPRCTETPDARRTDRQLAR